MLSDADEPEVLVDSSVGIALIVTDHDGHTDAVAALRGRRIGLAGHAWFETFSVLTRLPPGQRRSPLIAARILTANFPATRFLDEQASRDLADELGRLHIAGGAVYDALVGAVARRLAVPLVSRDSRARRTYEALGVTVEFL